MKTYDVQMEVTLEVWATVQAENVEEAMAKARGSQSARLAVAEQARDLALDEFTVTLVEEEAAE